MIDGYDWRGGREAMLRFGPADAPVAAIALPPFEEANRTRALMVGVARRLAAKGVAAVLPDLPGTGESLVPIGTVRLQDWREAFAAACAGETQVVTVSVRAGALVDAVAGALCHWRLSPQDGSRVLREMVRTRIAGAREDGQELTSAIVMAAGQRDGVELSGHWLSSALFGDLEGAEVPVATPLRVVRLGGDAQPADRLIDAPPPWRRAEPERNDDLVEQLATDIAQWVRTCAN